MHVARVIVESDLVEGISAVDPEATSRLIAKPGFGDQPEFLAGSWDEVRERPLLPGLSGVVLYGSRLRLRSSVLVHSETQDWMKRLIGFAAVEQLDVVEHRGIALADALKVRLAKSQPPSSGSRDAPDEMVGTIRAMSAVGSVSSWTDIDEFRATAQTLTSRGFVSTTDEGQSRFRGLTAEVPSGPRAGYAIEGGGSHLIMATTEHPHPTLGPGLLVRLLLRHAPRDHDGAVLSAVGLNALEATNIREAQFIGSWSGPSDALQFTTFLPNALYQPGAMQILCFTTIGRAHWIDSLP
jgi:hypothetical protein